MNILFRTTVALTILILGCEGCTQADRGNVDFVYLNLSTNEIWVASVDGLPREASPGRLPPVPDEGRLSEKSVTYTTPVPLGDKVTMNWDDGSKDGWPGGEYNKKGDLHRATWTREELGLPSVIFSGRIQFTYLGNDKWHVKLLK